MEGGFGLDGWSFRWPGEFRTAGASGWFESEPFSHLVGDVGGRWQRQIEILDTLCRAMWMKRERSWSLPRKGIHCGTSAEHFCWKFQMIIFFSVQGAYLAEWRDPTVCDSKRQEVYISLWLRMIFWIHPQAILLWMERAWQFARPQSGRACHYHKMLYRSVQVNRKERWFNLMLIAHTQKCIIIPKKKAAGRGWCCSASFCHVLRWENAWISRRIAWARRHQLDGWPFMPVDSKWLKKEIPQELLMPCIYMYLPSFTVPIGNYKNLYIFCLNVIFFSLFIFWSGPANEQKQTHRLPVCCHRRGECPPRAQGSLTTVAGDAGLGDGLWWIGHGMKMREIWQKDTNDC